jgi:hypothetical protein
MKFSVLISAFFVTCFIVVHSCTYDKGPMLPPLSNELLFEYVQKTAGKGYYQNGNTLNPAGNSPHSSFTLRMNEHAQQVLDNFGELSTGNIFPDSSLIVKENQTGSSIKYAVMFKNGGSWTWAEFGASGEVFYSITSEGKVCISCHSTSPNRDMTRTFDLH